MLAVGTVLLVAAIVCAIAGRTDLFAFVALALGALAGAHLFGGGVEIAERRAQRRARQP